MANNQDQAQDAIKKLDEKDKTNLMARVEKVRQNWDLVNKANKSVTNAEKVQNDANVKTAQSSIDKIKDEMAKSKKSSLQGILDKVKTTVKNNKERAKAADVNNAAAPQAEAPVVSGGAVDYGQYAEAPAQNAPAPTKPPTHNGGGNANSNVGLDEANDLDHASNRENSIDGGR